MSAFSATLNVVTGDTLPALTFTVRDSNTAAAGKTLDENDQSTWSPINLTGATVVLRVRMIGATGAPTELTGTVIDGAAGKVMIEFASDTFSVAGQYEAELEITFADGGVQTVVDLIKFKVRASFD